MADTNKQTAQERGYWTVKELARAAGVSGAYIRQLLLASRLPGNKAGSVWTIPYQAGRRWLENRRE